MESEELVITVYRVTGRQLFFRVADSLCEECDLAVEAAKRAAEESSATDVRVRVDVMPWLNDLARALRRGAYHPPAVLVDGKLVSQGFVPSVEGLKSAIREAIAERRRGKSSQSQTSVPVTSAKEQATKRQQPVAALDGVTRGTLS